MTTKKVTAQTDTQLLNDVAEMVQNAKIKVAHNVNETLIMLYWSIGKRIHDDIIKKNRAEYGGQIIVKLAEHLTALYGKGYSRRNIFRMMQFVKYFPDARIVTSLMAQLTWTHFIQLLMIEDPLKREFYAEMCKTERWSVRALTEKMNGMLYERTAIAKKPDDFIKKELANLRENDIMHPDLIFKDYYTLKFLGVDKTPTEMELEDAILANIEKFLLEMGAGFTFVERQKVIEIDGEHYRIDLLMYNRRLMRLIVCELKMGKFKAADKGQLELYLRWLEKHEMQPYENPPMGLVMCSSKSDEHVELLQLEKSGIRVAEFITELPSKEIFEKRLHDAIKAAKARYERLTYEDDIEANKD